MPADAPAAPRAGVPPADPDDLPLPRLSAAVLIALLFEIGLFTLLGWACA